MLIKKRLSILTRHDIWLCVNPDGKACINLRFKKCVLKKIIKYKNYHILLVYANTSISRILMNQNKRLTVMITVRYVGTGRAEIKSLYTIYFIL